MNQFEETLDPDVHEFIFQELIVPQRLARTTPQTEPVVVYLMAQPGAGKTPTASILKHALDQRGGATHFCSDYYKAYHPTYLRLLEKDPRAAGARIRQDYERWQTMGHQYVRERSADALVEMAPSSEERFRSAAEPFAAAGYRVHVVILAVPEAVSRQGTADRYVRQQQANGRGRFSTPEGHDRCYQAVADIAQGVDRGSLVQEVWVIRRGEHPLYHNVRDSAGRWSGVPGCHAALQDERNRPWNSAEARRFIATHQRLVAAAPEIGPELEQITALAATLLGQFHQAESVGGRPDHRGHAPDRAAFPTRPALTPPRDTGAAALPRPPQLGPPAVDHS
ncbi:zeta toxin family protein [Frankia sp. Cas4]|uniref:zeta toxin family protein n=1 Tax=Frankia sp. Cas4 TaxID=3073927 RepID=UPI002AD1D3CB|nr:zeta toxin family protein [Frankia sp. Cas4]